MLEAQQWSVDGKKNAFQRMQAFVVEETVSIQGD